MPCHINARSRAQRLMLSILLLSLACGLIRPASAEILEWTLWPLPGVVNVANEQPSDGLAVETLTLLMQQLPELQPRYRLGNRLRQQHDMEAGQNFCAAPLFRRADSDQFGYFIPFVVSSPIHAVIREADLHRFPVIDGKLSLTQLGRLPQLRGGYSAFRTYPPVLNRWLSETARQPSLESVTGSQSGENLVLMVSHDRIDYTFEFATILHVLSQSRLQQPLLALPIAEDMALIETGIYCTRNAWGLQISQRLDAAMRTLSQHPQQLLQIYAKWAPEYSQRAFYAQMQDYYRQRAQRVSEFH